MLYLKEMKKGTKFPDFDYLIEKEEKLDGVINVLTPKFIGQWVIILVEPRISFTKDLIDKALTPDWIDMHIYLNKKSLDSVVLEHPDMFPKRSNWKDEFSRCVAQVTNLLSVDASKVLYNAFRNNAVELETTLKQLDEECIGGRITLKQVKQTVNYTKIIYASTVIDAFLLKQKNRWSLYYQLVHNIGLQISYFAMYKYVKALMLDKNSYLHNEDYRNRIVSRVDAPLISYVFILFVNSNNYQQLPGLLHAIDARSSEQLERIADVSI